MPIAFSRLGEGLRAIANDWKQRISNITPIQQPPLIRYNAINLLAQVYKRHSHDSGTP